MEELSRASAFIQHDYITDANVCRVWYFLVGGLEFQTSTCIRMLQIHKANYVDHRGMGPWLVCPHNNAVNFSGTSQLSSQQPNASIVPAVLCDAVRGEVQAAFQILFLF